MDVQKTENDTEILQNTNTEHNYSSSGRIYVNARPDIEIHHLQGYSKNQKCRVDHFIKMAKDNNQKQ